MPNYRAVANGNWSSLATWQDDGSGSYVASTVLPGAADTVRTNNFTVTVNINATVLNLSNDSATGVTQGGGFILNNNITLTATNTALHTATSSTFITLAAGATATFSCPSTTSSSGTSRLAESAAARTLNIISNILFTLLDGSIRPNGGTINITGNLTSTIGGATQGNIVDFNNGGTCNITGNVSAANAAFWVRGTCNLTLTGSLTTGASPAYTNTNQNVTFTHIGPVIVNGNAAGIVDTFGIYAGTGPFTNNGDFAPVAAIRFRLINTSPTSMRLATSVVSVNSFLYTEDSVGGAPATSNVRQGTVYGIGGGLTGTLAVPSPSNVRQGVPTDNTVGTADLTAQDFFTAIANSSDPIAVRLRNVATVQTTGDQIAAAL